MSVTIATRPNLRHAATDSPPVDPVRAWLARLPAELPAFAPASFAAAESCTPAEVHAAARAAGCPDLFLIHAADPVVGERVIAETARLASERVLILSPDPAAADNLTERLAKLGVVRALADDENPIRPSPVVARLTSAALGCRRLEELKREASESLAAAEERLAACDRLDALQGELAELGRQRETIDAEVRGSQCRTELVAQERELTELRRRHAEAGAGKKSGLFGWLFGRSKPAAAEPTVLEKEILHRESALATLQREWEIAVRTEVDRRACALDQRRGECEAERDRLDTKIGGSTRADAEHARAAASERLTEMAAPGFIQQLLTEPRIVVGTPGSLQADPAFATSAANETPFALLILDRCEELTEPDFLHLAALASRWVLVGDAHSRQDHRPRGNNGKAGRNGRPAESFAGRLARLLDRETWTREGDRLVCRLMHVGAASGRPALTREPLLDRPEIELRFATDGDGEPVVAEVAFPLTTPIAEAKAFLFHQLGEVLLHPCGTHCWSDPSALAVRWAAAEHPSLEQTWIDLEPGVREKVCAAGLIAFTAAIEFDPAAGWDRTKADAWLAKHLRTETASRVAMLTEDGKRR